MNSKHLKILLKVALAVLVIVLIVWLNRFAIESETIQKWVTHFGYPGIFFSSVLSGFNLLIPIPIIGFYPFLIEAGFSSLPLILTISFGMLCGDIFGYLIGKYGRSVAREKKYSVKMMEKIEQLRDKHTIIPLVFLFIYVSVVPLPNELVVIPMGFMGYRLRSMFFSLFFGNVLFNTLSAWGFLNVLHLI